MIQKIEKLLLFFLILLLPSQLTYHFWPLWSLVNGLRVDYLSPTVYLTDLLIIGLIILSRTRSKIPLLAIIFAVLNILISQYPNIAIYKWLRLLEYFWLYQYLVSIPNTLYVIRNTLPLSVIWTSLLTWVQFLKQSSLGGILYWLGERTFDITTPGIAKIALDGQLLLRPYATLPHPNTLAGFLLVGGLLTYHLCHSDPERCRRGHWSLVIALATIPLTFSRTAILLEAVILGLWIIFKLAAPKVFKFLLVLLPFVFCLLTLSFGNPTSFSERLFLIQKSHSLIKNHPLLGVGLGNFIPSPYSLFPIPYSLVLQPVHNIFLLLASELGIPAVLITSIWIIGNYLKIKNWKLKIPLLVILIIGVVDHYWLTLHQPELLVVVLLSLIKIKSLNNDEQSTK